MTLTDKQLEEICDRSADGEGVAAILKSLGINASDGLIYLRDNHIGAIEAAKKQQVLNKKQGTFGVKGTPVKEPKEAVK